jgi:hypothetical protein
LNAGFTGSKCFDAKIWKKETKIMNYLFNRLKEPSTYAGLAILASVAGHLPSLIAAASNPVQLAIGVCGLIAIAIKENKSAAVSVTTKVEEAK